MIQAELLDLPLSSLRRPRFAIAIELPVLLLLLELLVDHFLGQLLGSLLPIDAAFPLVLRLAIEFLERLHLAENQHPVVFLAGHGVAL